MGSGAVLSTQRGPVIKSRRDAIFVAPPHNKTSKLHRSEIACHDVAPTGLWGITRRRQFYKQVAPTELARSRKGPSASNAPPLHGKRKNSPRFLIPLRLGPAGRAEEFMLGGGRGHGPDFVIALRSRRSHLGVNVRLIVEEINWILRIPFFFTHFLHG